MSSHILPGLEHAPAAITPLPAETIAQIKSSTTITSLTGVVFGLIENALDAQATNVNVTVSLRRGGCTVEDDGLGIPPSEFDETGCLGRMYHTSKHGTSLRQEVHGGTGTFMASLAALSLVTITSHHHQHYSHNTLVFHRTKPIVRLTPAPSQHHIRGSAHGTRVVVRNLFGNMPVRVKQRALTGDIPSEIDKFWHTLKKGVVALLLSWKGAVTIKLSNDENRSRGFTITTRIWERGNALSNRSVNTINRTASYFEPKRALSILVQASFAAPGSNDSWVPVSADSSSLSIKGSISLDPAPTKFTQFIALGIRPCTDESGYHDLYDVINNIFRDSSFGQAEDDSGPDEAELERRKHDRRFKRDGPTDKQRNGGRKGVDRWPRFVFQLEVKATPQSKQRNSIRLETMTDILGALVTQWLEANHFRPRQRKRKEFLRQSELTEQFNTSEDGSLPPSSTLSTLADKIPPPYISIAKGTELFAPPDNQSGVTDKTITSRSTPRPKDRQNSAAKTPQTPFTDWSRIKSGKPARYENIWKCNSLTDIPKSSARSDAIPSMISIQPFVADCIGTRTFTSVFESNSVSEPLQPLSSCLNEAERPQDVSDDEIAEWEDPITKRRFMINARTGIVVRNAPRAVSEDLPGSTQPAGIKTQPSAFGRPWNLQRRKTAPAGTKPSPWLEKLIKEWKNPLFANQLEEPIPVAAFDGPGHETGSNAHHCENHNMDQSFLQAGQGTTSRMSKLSLLDAQVISQIDQKFILLKLPSVPGGSDGENGQSKPLLVLVDQHAASERCILEGLLAELCRPHTDGIEVRSNLGHRSHIQITHLDKPLYFQISAKEEVMLKAHAAHFARWGILYNIKDRSRTEDSSEKGKLAVITLPPGVVERCRTEPKRLIQLLRSEIYELADTPSSTNRAQREEVATQDDPHYWLRQMGSCPKSIINMLNSRACRSAIMFNDKLSVLECRELVQNLAKCAFPFICAHGRVSIVPMVYLDSMDILETSPGKSSFEQGTKSEEVKGSFAKAFKQWRSKEGQAQR